MSKPGDGGRNDHQMVDPQPLGIDPESLVFLRWKNGDGSDGMCVKSWSHHAKRECEWAARHRGACARKVERAGGLEVSQLRLATYMTVGEDMQCSTTGSSCRAHVKQLSLKIHRAARCVRTTLGIVPPRFWPERLMDASPPKMFLFEATPV